MSSFGLIEKNMELSHIYLAVQSHQVTIHQFSIQKYIFFCLIPIELSWAFI
jgi:hypothetical protein